MIDLLYKKVLIISFSQYIIDCLIWELSSKTSVLATNVDDIQIDCYWNENGVLDIKQKQIDDLFEQLKEKISNFNLFLIDSRLMDYLKKIGAIPEILYYNFSEFIASAKHFPSKSNPLSPRKLMPEQIVEKLDEIYFS